MIVAARFLLGGSEDTWICVNDEWVRHGNPRALEPEGGCGEEKCTFGNSSMDLDDAKSVAEEGECSRQGVIGESGFCNSGTGTWWIDFTPSEEKQGCNPACVVNVETKEVEINWRCTGLTP